MTYLFKTSQKNTLHGLKQIQWFYSLAQTSSTHLNPLTCPPCSVPALHSSRASSPLNTVLFYSARHHHSDASADHSTERNIKTQAPPATRGPRASASSQSSWTSSLYHSSCSYLLSSWTKEALKAFSWQLLLWDHRWTGPLLDLILKEPYFSEG